MKKQLKLVFSTLIVSVMFVLFFTSVSWSVPASPFPFAVTQPDGTTVDLYRRGDEFRNWIESAEGYTLIKNEITGYWDFAVFSDDKLVTTGVTYSLGKAPPPGLEKHQKPKDNKRFRKATRMRSASAEWWKPRPIDGTYKILLIRVEFDDQKFSDKSTEELLIEQVFGEINSVKEYYFDQSLGKLKIVPAIDKYKVITVTLESDHPDRSIAFNIDVEEAHKNEVAFVTEVLVAVRDKHTDFKLSDFDTNKDGYVTPNELALVVDC